MSHACDIVGIQPKTMGPDHTPRSTKAPKPAIDASCSSAASRGVLEACSSALSSRALEPSCGSLARSYTLSSGLSSLSETFRQTLGVSSIATVQTQISAAFKMMASLGTVETLLEKDRKRREQMLEALNPGRGLAEALRGISSVEMPGQAIQEMVQRMERNLQLDSFQPTISVQFAELYGISGPAAAFGHAITVHATPAAPAERRSVPSARTAKKSTFPRSARHDKASLSQNSEEEIETTLAWDQQGDLPQQEVSITIHRFIERQDAPTDPRVGLEVAAMWCSKNQHRLHPAWGQKFNLLMQSFLCECHGKSAPPHVFKVLSSGLLIPSQDPEQRQLDLDPTIYSTQQLAKKVHRSVDALRRLAAKALSKGTLPQPLEECPGWFLVQASDPKGGSGCGWKFQHLRQEEDTSQTKENQAPTIRSTQIRPNRHH